MKEKNLQPRLLYPARISFRFGGEIKNSLEGINSRITEEEEWISDLEDKIVEMTTAEQNKEKRM